MTTSKLRATGLVLGLTLSFAAPLTAEARDSRLQLPIADALATPDAQAKVNPNVKLFWGTQQYPKPVQAFGEITSNKKTNNLNKSDKEGCQWTFLSAVIALQEKAVQEGGNAVVEIRSVYRDDNVVSETEFECGAGAFLAGVALRGTIVKLP